MLLTLKAMIKTYTNLFPVAYEDIHCYGPSFNASLSTNPTR